MTSTHVTGRSHSRSRIGWHVRSAGFCFLFRCFSFCHGWENPAFLLTPAEPPRSSRAAPWACNKSPAAMVKCVAQLFGSCSSEMRTRCALRAAAACCCRQLLLCTRSAPVTWRLVLCAAGSACVVSCARLATHTPARLRPQVHHRGGTCRGRRCRARVRGWAARALVLRPPPRAPPAPGLTARLFAAPREDELQVQHPQLVRDCARRSR